ncbi:MAG: hypothetical protein JO202_07355 [Ktedonobacteraceae bacterium]|nr:hypothetical protein [Ktedonobacteraceae bacterium]
MKDIVVLCDGSRVDELVDAFNCPLEGETSRAVLWCGITHRYGLGVIVLECEEEASEFLHALQEESDIFDFSESSEDTTFSVAGASGGNSPSC